MHGVLEGSWRKASDGQYKVLVSGSEKEVGSIVEVFARYGGVKYIVITGTNSKLKTGGYLYDFRYMYLSTQKRSTYPVEKRSTFRLRFCDFTYRSFQPIQGFLQPVADFYRHIQNMSLVGQSIYYCAC